jgi:hypothetical protein
MTRISTPGLSQRLLHLARRKQRSRELLGPIVDAGGGAVDREGVDLRREPGEQIVVADDVEHVATVRQIGTPPQSLDLLRDDVLDRVVPLENEELVVIDGRDAKADASPTRCWWTSFLPLSGVNAGRTLTGECEASVTVQSQSHRTE